MATSRKNVDREKKIPTHVNVKEPVSEITEGKIVDKPLTLIVVLPLVPPGGGKSHFGVTKMDGWMDDERDWLQSYLMQ